jgi:hypothetical protein
VLYYFNIIPQTGRVSVGLVGTNRGSVSFVATIGYTMNSHSRHAFKEQGLVELRQYPDEARLEGFS